MTKEDIIVKVRKILNLASNNSSKEESEAAMTKVQELLLKYDLSLSDIEIKENRLIEYQVGKVNPTISVIATVLSDFFRVSYFYYNHPHRTGICIGHEIDITIFKNVLEYCLIYFEKEKNKFIDYKKQYINIIKRRGDNLKWDGYDWQELPQFNINDKELEKNFLIGFVQGLKSKLSENTNRFALVLKKSEEHEKKINEMKIKYTNVAVPKYVDHETINAGRRSGENFKKINKELSK
jgi:hypothetical protein